MATIGTFTKSENGFSGKIKTVTLDVKAKFAPAEKEKTRLWITASSLAMAPISACSTRRARLPIRVCPTR
jgi:hypothetical protein